MRSILGKRRLRRGGDYQARNFKLPEMLNVFEVVVAPDCTRYYRFRELEAMVAKTQIIPSDWLSQ